MAASSRSRASSVRTCGSVMTFSCRRPPGLRLRTRGLHPEPSLRRADVYQVKAGYAALPKLDKREEPFVRVQVAEGHLGINAIHIPAR